MVQYAYKKGTRGERHGSAAERLLAKSNPDRARVNAMMSSFAVAQQGKDDGDDDEQCNQGAHQSFDDVLGHRSDLLADSRVRARPADSRSSGGQLAALSRAAVGQRQANRRALPAF